MIMSSAQTVRRSVANRRGLEEGRKKKKNKTKSNVKNYIVKRRLKPPTAGAAAHVAVTRFTLSDATARVC